MTRYYEGDQVLIKVEAKQFKGLKNIRLLEALSLNQAWDKAYKPSVDDYKELVADFLIINGTITGKVQDLTSCYLMVHYEGSPFIIHYSITVLELVAIRYDCKNVIGPTATDIETLYDDFFKKGNQKYIDLKKHFKQ